MGPLNIYGTSVNACFLGQNVFESRFIFLLDSAGIKVHKSNDFLFHFQHLLVLVNWCLSNFKLFSPSLPTLRLKHKELN